MYSKIFAKRRDGIKINTFVQCYFFPLRGERRRKDNNISVKKVRIPRHHLQNIESILVKTR